jgi:monofunctional chorismate mutase
MPIRGIRGATTVPADEPDLILQATRELLEAILAENDDMRPEDIASAVFTVTDDLAATFPAQAALYPRAENNFMDDSSIFARVSSLRCCMFRFHLSLWDRMGEGNKTDWSVCFYPRTIAPSRDGSHRESPLLLSDLV